MKEKYIIISSYVSHETKTSVSISPVFNTAIEALLHHQKLVADTNEYASPKSYTFYEVCHWHQIDTTNMYGKSLLEIQCLAKIEAESLIDSLKKPVIFEDKTNA